MVGVAVVMPPPCASTAGGRIGPAAVAPARRVEPGGPRIIPAGHTGLILGADAPHAADVYGHKVRLVPAVRRDACAHPGDYGLAGAMTGVALVALVSRIDVDDADLARFHPDTWWAGVATIVICALLVGRRRWPLRTLAAGLALVLPLELARQRDVVAFFVVVVLVYSVAAHLPPRLAWRGPALVAGLYAVLLASGTVILSAVPLLGPGFLAAAFALGVIIRRGRTRQRREVDAAIEQAAAAIETADLEAADERLRMAQELHDVVAHSLSVIAVQAGIGAHLIGRRPAEAALALDAIRTTCDTTDGELGRLVAILRHGGPANSTARTPAPQRRPAPERRPSPMWRRWWSRSGRLVWPSPSPSRGTRRPCPTACRWPPTASCRRR